MPSSLHIFIFIYYIVQFILMTNFMACEEREKEIFHTCAKIKRLLYTQTHSLFSCCRLFPSFSMNLMSHFISADVYVCKNKQFLCFYSAFFFFFKVHKNYLFSSCLFVALHCWKLYFYFYEEARSHFAR